jgi:hydroxypyruvate isomerase
MTRREILAAGAAVAVAQAASTEALAQKKKPAFKLKYGPHPGQFSKNAPGGVLDELKFSADQGFLGWEDNGMKARPPEEQEKIGKELRRLGMTMGIFVMNGKSGFKGGGTLTTGDPAARDAYLDEVKESVDVAKRCGAKYMTSLVGMLDVKLPIGYQFANVVDCLRRASDILEPHGLVMVYEPLNIYENHPGFFIHSNDWLYAMMKSVRSPSCKILYDLYHSQINEGHLIYNYDKCLDEIGYIQTGDVPGRAEPGTGEVNYRNIFKHIYEKGYTGVVGMEHGAAKGKTKEAELAVIAAYRDADNFPVTAKKA